MTTVRLLPFEVVKEVRALLVVWLACLAAILANSVVNDYIIFIAVIVFAVGSIGLGTLSIGHEYTHRTLPLLLSLPANRRRLLVIKIGVLATMLLTLGVATWGSVSGFGAKHPGTDWYTPALVPLGIASGLFIAPWLTMLSRSPLAGLVLTATLPALLWFAGDMLGIARFGLLQPAAVARVRFDVLAWGMSVASLVAAALGWRTFMRLEAIDATGVEIQVPTFALRHSDARRSHVSTFSSLVRKELRLQQLAFVVAGIYALIWLTVSIVNRFVLAVDDDSLQFLTVFYLAILSVLIGAQASAEERHLGTHEWHLLLPMAPWKQWSVKAGTAFLLAILLGMGLPASMWYIDSVRPRSLSVLVPELLVLHVFLTSCGLYISSLCRSGVTALLLTIPAIIGGLVLTSAVYAAVLSVVRLSTIRDGVRVFGAVSPVVVCTVAVCFAALLCWFAFRNHRFAESGRARVWRQGLGMATFLLMSLLGILAIMLSAA